jgi:uncharacterized membrane protein
VRSRRVAWPPQAEGLVVQESIGEPRWLPILAVLSAAGLYVTLPGRFIVGSSSGALGIVRWVVPVFTIALVGPLALSAPKRRIVPSVGRRAAAIALIGLISLANAAAIVLVVHLLITGASTHARELIRAAIHLWCMNVLIFGLWFWQLDGGGPAARLLGGAKRDFLFPQMTIPELSVNWYPKFLDYLYVSFTNATAFSPTDTMPLSPWAKVLMMIQSAASLLLAVMVAARAVNILK